MAHIPIDISSHSVLFDWGYWGVYVVWNDDWL